MWFTESLHWRRSWRWR